MHKSATSKLMPRVLSVSVDPSRMSNRCCDAARFKSYRFKVSINAGYSSPLAHQSKLNDSMVEREASSTGKGFRQSPTPATTQTVLLAEIGLG